MPLCNTCLHCEPIPNATFNGICHSPDRNIDWCYPDSEACYTHYLAADPLLRTTHVRRIACYNCGLAHDETDIKVWENRKYCPSCYDRLIKPCAHCGTLVHIYTAVQHGSQFLCQSCYSTAYHRCCNCSRLELITDGTYIEFNHSWFCPICYRSRVQPCVECGNPLDTYGAFYRNGEHICQVCFESKYIGCSWCGAAITPAEAALRRGDSYYCDRCATEFVECEDCGTHVHRDDLYRDDYNDDPLCYSCFRARRGEHLNCYSHKPDPIFLGETTGKRTLYMGVELEVDNGDHRGQAVKAIHNLTDLVYMKEDGSLDSGFEIVSHPATLPYHLDDLPWGDIMTAAKKYHFRSHDVDTCGLHVHVNRDFFGSSRNVQDLNIAKVLILVNNIWDQLTILSRRDSTHWAQKPKLDIKPSDTRRVITEKAKACARDGRYQAVNLTNFSTIEFRTFKGTLKLETFFATLELVSAICRYAKTHSLLNVQNTTWDKFRKSCTGSYLPDYMHSEGV